MKTLEKEWSSPVPYHAMLFFEKVNTYKERTFSRLRVWLSNQTSMYFGSTLFLTFFLRKFFSVYSTSTPTIPKSIQGSWIEVLILEC